MKNIFINKNVKLRSGWKISIVLGSYLLAVVALGILVGIAAIIITLVSTNQEAAISMDRILNEITTGQTSLFVLTVLQGACMFFAVLLFWKVFDKKPIKDIGLVNIKIGYKDFLIGLLFGAASIIIVFAILFATGDISLAYSLLKPNVTPSLILGLIMFVFVGLGEEIFSRGYCMTVLNQGNRKWVAVVVSSAIFSLLHSLNFSVSLLALINIFLIGVLFAYMVIKTGNIWMPIGYHITWNYFQGNIFGLQVSGSHQVGLYKTDIPAANMLNGGGFGPEGGLIVTLIILLGFIVIWKLVKNKGNSLSSTVKNV